MYHRVSNKMIMSTDSSGLQIQSGSGMVQEWIQIAPNLIYIVSGSPELVSNSNSPSINATASYIEGKLRMVGENGTIPMIFNSYLTAGSPIRDGINALHISKPVVAENIPVDVIKISGSVVLVTDSFIPIVIGGEVFKLALVQ